MLYGTRDEVIRLAAEHEELAVFVSWLATYDPAELADGMHQLDGDRLIAAVMSCSTRDPQSADYEIHRDHIDIQMDLEGTEDIIVAQGDMTATSEYDEVLDVLMCRPSNSSEAGERYTLGPDRMIVLFPHEPHLPMLTPEGEEAAPVRKVIFKVQLL